MSLNDIKRKRLAKDAKIAKAKRRRRKKKLTTDPDTGNQRYVRIEDEETEVFDEERKAYLVKICVAAASKKKKALTPAPGPPKTEKLGVKDAQQTVKEYAQALEKLREAVEERSAQNPDPRSIVFGARPYNADPTPNQIRFDPYQ